MRHDSGIASLEHDLRQGRLSRRDFIRRAVALGASASVVAAVLAACGASPMSTNVTVATAVPATATPAATGGAANPAATATGSASPAAAAGGAATSPATPPVAAATKPPASPASSGPTKRGGGGTVKLLQWQAPTIMNPHLSSGTKDELVTRIVYEPLLSVDNEGKFFAVLADGVPSNENGQVTSDGRSVTCTLKQSLKWSDGQPVTAADVIFTWEYVTDKATTATSFVAYESVEKIEQLDDLTLKYTFKDTTPAWSVPLLVPVIPRHVFEKDKGEGARNSPNNLKPVGTGAYKVVEFKPGDLVSYTINENYREPNKPYFDRVEVKGGGDETSAARAVLQTGDYDYAWNLQITDAVLQQLETGGKGVVQFQPGRGIERLLLNFTDPNKEDKETGERSSLKFPHPFLADLKVRQGFALATDRESIVKALYGRGGEVSVNILNVPPQFRSNNNKAEFSLEKAGALLDESGWKKSGQYREKNGVTMALVYQTSVNALRQRTQQIVKDGWEKSGIKTELKSIDAGVFFGSDAGNPDNIGHFYADVQMYNSLTELDPQGYMRAFVSRFADQKANKWAGGNRSRYQNPEYDKLWDQAKTEMDPRKRAQLFIQMNDIVVQNVVHIPLVSAKSVFAHAKNLQNINYTIWDSQYWNIANWTRG